MSSFEIHSGDKKVVYQILEEELTIGSHPSNQLRVQGEGVAGCHLKLRREDGVISLEDMLTASKFRVNGRVRDSHVLEHGDFVELGSSILVYLEAGQPKPLFRRPKHIDEAGAVKPVVESIEFVDDEDLGDSESPDSGGDVPMDPVAARLNIQDVPKLPQSGGRRAAASSIESRSSHRRTPLRRQQSGAPQWILFSSLVTLTALVALVLIRWTQDAEFEKDPSDLLMLARSQNDQGHMQRALATLSVAERSSPDPATAKLIAALRKRIGTAIQKQADIAMLAQAEMQLKPVVDFEKRYLRDTPDHRPACREMLRLANEWLANYGDLCRKYEEYIGFANQVDGMRSRYTASARLGEPDDLDDVLFSSARRSRFNPRHYREAIGILDAWLLKNPEDGRVTELQVLREQFVVDGRKWVARKVRMATGLAETGQRAAAISELRFVIDTGALPEWTEAAVSKLAELEAAPRK